LDLSDVVGPAGRVTGLERSPRFLQHLRGRLATEPQRKIDLIEIDLDSSDFPSLSPDGAWCRWVFAFVTRPRDLLRHIRGSLKPGAALVIHEYFDYRTFGLVPREPDFAQFVEAVMASWRANGGEPDVAVDLLPWLPAEGFRIVEVRPLIDAVSPADFVWQWPATFLETGLERLLDLGFLTSDKAARVKEAFERAARNPQSRLITPGLLEVIALAT